MAIRLFSTAEKGSLGQQMKKIIYIDMDDTIADFHKAAVDDGKVVESRMWNKDFFLNLEPIPGSKGAINDLSRMGYDLWILSQPLAESPESYTDKALWIQRHFPQLYNKIVLTQNKGLHVGDYLIDDNAEKWKTKFEANGGKFIHYPYHGESRNHFLPEGHIGAWRRIVEFFKSESSK